jgi:hypothetical protein
MYLSTYLQMCIWYFSILTYYEMYDTVYRSDINIEGLALHRAFEEALKRQLDPVWQSVGWKTRQIVKASVCSLNRGMPNPSCPTHHAASGSQCTHIIRSLHQLAATTS